MAQFAAEWLSAGLGCAIADSIFNPLEVMKVKLQVQPATRSIYPGGMLASLQQVAAEDGLFRGLYTPGLTATIVRSMTYGTLGSDRTAMTYLMSVGFRIGMYPTMREFVNGGAEQKPGLGSKIAAGALTGAIGSAVFCPIDVVRVRMQVDAGTVDSSGVLRTGVRQGHCPRYSSTFAAFPEILHQEGLLGFWRGGSATILRASILSGAQLASYDVLKRTAKRANLLEDGPILHSTCSLISGIIAQTCMMPVDTARSCLMGTDHGTWRQVFDLVRQGGVRVLYRGYFPACARQGPVMLVQMPLVEYFRELCGLEGI